jgi:hypothetical protein
MSITLGGTNPAVTFPDGTIQNTAGAVLQVVNANTTTPVSTTSTTYVDVGLSASITPKFATSKILIIGTVEGIKTAAINTGVKVSLYKGTSATILSTPVAYAGFNTSSTDNNTCASVSYLDSPATTSSTTYAFAFLRNTGSGNVDVQNNAAMSTITLMEIAG